MPDPQLTLDDLKQQAKSLRRSLAASGQVLSHSQSLETIAHQHGFKDWNTCHAAIGNRPPVPLHVGQQVSGKYLGKAFSGKIITLSSIGEAQWFRLAIRFDEAVDVSAFESMKVERRQINATIDRFGCSAEKTSNGVPHLALDIA